MEDGGLRLPDSLSGMWGKAMARRGLVGLHLHDLRHSYVSIRIHAHEDIATVAKRVGHSSPRTTAQHYAHAIEDAEQGDGDELLDAVFARAAGAVTRTPPIHPAKRDVGGPLGLRTHDNKAPCG